MRVHVCTHMCACVHARCVCACVVRVITGFSWLQRTETCSSYFSWSLQTCKLQAASRTPPVRRWKCSCIGSTRSGLQGSLENYNGPEENQETEPLHGRASGSRVWTDSTETSPRGWCGFALGSATHTTVALLCAPSQVPWGF